MRVKNIRIAGIDKARRVDNAPARALAVHPRRQYFEDVRQGFDCSFDSQSCTDIASEVYVVAMAVGKQQRSGMPPVAVAYIQGGGAVLNRLIVGDMRGPLII